MKTLFTVSLLTVMLSACQSTPRIDITEFEPGSCRFKSTQTPAPDWYCAPDDMFDPKYVYGVGSASNKYSDDYLARKIAITNGRADLTAKIATEVFEEYERDIQASEVDQDVMLQITTRLRTAATVKLDLPATRKKAQVFDEKGNLHVLMEVNRSAIEAASKKMRARIERASKAAYAQQHNSDSKAVIETLRDARNGLD